MVRISPSDTFICFADDESQRRFTIDSDNVEVRRVEVSRAASHAASASGSRSVRDMLAMTRAVRNERLDVFFSPSVYTYFPLPPRLRAVVTIHDAIAERFPELTLPSARARLFWWMKVRLALFQSTRVLTVSDYAAGDVRRVHRVPKERIDVAVEAPSDSFHRRDRIDVLREAASHGLSERDRWFVYVGGFNPHKNVQSIVRAHSQLVSAQGGNAPHLMLVGTTDRDVFHGDVEGIREAIQTCGTTRFVHWTGFLPDDRLSALHSGAIALLLPSAVEGFGLPAMEAAACGSAVIATVESPLPELLAGGGIFVEPGDDASLSAAMSRLANDEGERSGMASVAYAKARALSWPAAAAAAMASIRAAAA